MTVLLLSCTSSTDMSDLEVDKNTFYVYKNGKAFSGTAWSSDGKTINITCHNGVVDSIIAYHANGKTAVKSLSFRRSGTCYDNTGKPISMENFINRYPDLVEKIAALSFEIKGL